MKKFEEEVKRPSNAGIDPFSKRDVSFEKLSSKFTKGAQTLKEWKEYAFKAEDRIRELESQLDLQQPEIPEVPPFVADCLALIEANDYMISHEQATEHKEALVWLEDHQSKLMLPKCLLYGYTVEKSKTIVSPCPVCRFEDVKANFCGICGHKNEYVEVAKEKRYEVVFLEDDTTRQILMENHAGYHFIEEEDENYGYWKQDFTEKEIKAINEKFWQLSVPVENEQIEVEE